MNTDTGMDAGMDTDTDLDLDINMNMDIDMDTDMVTNNLDIYYTVQGGQTIVDYFLRARCRRRWGLQAKRLAKTDGQWPKQ